MRTEDDRASPIGIDDRMRANISPRQVPQLDKLEPRVEMKASALPSLRFEVTEAAQILRMSRAQLYNRINDGSLKRQKDGARTYITRAELERYVQACGPDASC